jgi:hypothetical protein
MLLFARGLLWGLMVFVTVLVTIILSSEPRYYIMVLPLMLLAWLQMLINVANRMPRKWGELLIVGGLSLVTLNNFSASVRLLKEQRAGDRFLQVYKGGKWLPAVRMAELIRQQVKPGESVIGPSGSVLSYLSGVHVYTQRELAGRVPQRKLPGRIRDLKVRYVVLPAPLYRDKEPLMYRMASRRLLVGYPTIATTSDGWRLAGLRVVVPKGDWTKAKKSPSTTHKSAKRAKPKGSDRAVTKPHAAR